MGFNELHVPGRVVEAWLASVGVLVVVALVVATNRVRLGLVVLVTGVVAFPVVARAWNPDVAYQGRYVLPLAVGVPILAGCTIDRRLATWRVPRGAALVLITVGAGVVHLVAHQALMSRNLHGFPAPVFAPRRSELWDGPLTPDLLFAGAVLSSAMVAALGVGLVLRGRTHGPSAVSSVDPVSSPIPQRNRGGSE
jgi:hypothetical protein